MPIHKDIKCKKSVATCLASSDVILDIMKPNILIDSESDSFDFKHKTVPYFTHGHFVLLSQDLHDHDAGTIVPQIESDLNLPS